ncbi:MAG: hypothetical protein K8T10_03540 [Candidatus Eremiobacteraeota bacterium]|nr:hypothetical protein [Candidatus Eremiobacteraeota bacterium]
MKRLYLLALIFVLPALFAYVCGCSGAGSSTVLSTPTPTITPCPTVTPCPTITPTPTVTPTVTPTPSTISGVVYDSVGLPLDGARVILTPLDGLRVRLTPQACASHKYGAVQEYTTRDGGQYSFTVQSGGGYRIEAWMGETLLSGQRFTVTDGDNLTIDFGTPSAQLTVYAWQNEAMTHPVTNFTAELTPTDSNENGSTKTCREAGSVTLENLSAGDYVLTVTYEGLEEIKKVKLELGENTENIVLYRWHEQFLKDHWLIGVYFVDTLNGWIAGQNRVTFEGMIIKTIDGGKTWGAPQDINGTRLFRRLHFIDNQTGWVVGETLAPTTRGVIVKTTDGGATWGAPYIIDEIYALNSVYFIDNQTGWAVGMTQAPNRGAIIKTTDGGASWSAPYVYDGASNLSAVYFTENLIGWVTGFSCLIKTTDGGTIWNSRDISLLCNSIYFTDSMHGWIAVERNPLRTIDGGETWDESLHFIEDMVVAYDIYFTDNMNGWTAGTCEGAKGGISRSRDGGRTWSKPVVARDMLSSIHCVNERRGWAVGFETLMRYAPLSE